MTLAPSEQEIAGERRPASSATTSPWRGVAVAGAALVALALFLAYADSSFNGYRVQITTLIAINVVVAVSLQITNGFTGVFSLGLIGFYAIGAYVGALLTIPPLWKAPNFLPGLPTWLAELDTSGWQPQLALLVACLAGGGLAALVAVVVGAPLMRLSGHYVAVATLGFLIITYSVEVNWEEVTRGARGLNQIPSHTNLWVAYAWAVLTVAAALRLRFSAYGRAMIAQRDNQIAARAIGVAVLRTRLLAFVTGAFFAGAGGALYAHQIGTISPRAFYFDRTFEVVIMIVLGGLGSVSGAVTGALIMTLLPEYLRELEDGFTLGPLEVGDYFGLQQIILAVGFILVMIFRPRGIFGDRELGAWIFDRWRRPKPKEVDADPSS
jgi:branched-chain amino acid transport system permease protein